MKAMLVIVLIFTVFTLTVSAQELIPATSEDQEMFDQQLEQAEQPQKPVKSIADTKDRKARFGATVKEEAIKLKAADVSTRKGMGQRISDIKRKNTGAAGGSSSTASDGKNSAPQLNDSGARGNSGNRKK